MKKQILMVFTTLCLLLVLLPTTARAEGYYFTIRTQSDNVENACHSNRSALSPALTVGNPVVSYRLTYTYDENLCDVEIDNLKSNDVITSGSYLPANNFFIIKVSNIADGYRIKDFLINGESHAYDMIDSKLGNSYGWYHMRCTEDTFWELILEKIPDQLPTFGSIDIYPDGSNLPVESVIFSDTLQVVTADVSYADGNEYPDYYASCHWEYSLNGITWTSVPTTLREGWERNFSFDAGRDWYTDPEGTCDPTIDFLALENYYLRVRVSPKKYYSTTPNGEAFYSEPIRVNWTTPMLPQDNAREQEVTAQVNLTTGLTAGQVVHLMAALYDEEGRFLSMEQKTVTVNSNCEVQEALVMKYGKANEPNHCKVFILNSDNAPIQVAVEEELDLDGPLTRGGCCALLAEALGITGHTPANGDAVFSDLSADDEYYEVIMALVQRGYIAGYSDGTFRPNDNMNAYQVALLFLRTGLCGEEYVTLPEESYKNQWINAMRDFLDSGIMNHDDFYYDEWDEEAVYRSDVNFEMVKLLAKSISNA